MQFFGTDHREIDQLRVTDRGRKGVITIGDARSSRMHGGRPTIVVLKGTQSDYQPAQNRSRLSSAPSEIVMLVKLSNQCLLHYKGKYIH